MIKVEIKQVFEPDKSDFYIVRTIKIFGLTIHKKIIKPVRWENGSIEFMYNV